MRRRWTTILPAALTAIGLAVAAAACSPIKATRGNIVENERVAELQVGASTVDDVLDVLGTPSTVGTFDDRIWYYIGERTERMSFFEPEIIERRILMVAFDDFGVLQQLEERDLEHGEEVVLVERETPTLGRRITFFEQMFGNLGRFNPGDDE